MGSSRSSRPFPLGSVAAFMAVMSITVAAGCGSSANNESATATATNVYGTFGLESILIGESRSDIDPAADFRVEIDEYGGLEIGSACNRLLGSISTLTDGRAGVTIVGRNERDCTAQMQQQQERVETLLAVVDTWSTTDDGFSLTEAKGASLRLTRR